MVASSFGCQLSKRLNFGNGSVVPVQAMLNQSPAPRTASRVAYGSCTSKSGHSWQRQSQDPTAAQCQSA